MTTSIDGLTRPERLLTCAEALAAGGVPREAGVYGWWFDGLADRVPTEGCVTRAGAALLYVGIAPRNPPKGRKPSRQTLRSAVRTHAHGSAATSTLRLSLGSLNAEELELRLTRTGTGERLTYGPGEERLTGWIEEHGRLSWVTTPRPWEHEPRLLAELSLPLNIQGNDHPFAAELARLRATQRWGAA